MISQEVKDKIKFFRSKFVCSFAEFIEEGELQSSLRFTDESDLEFELIDFFYDGVLSKLIEDARERAERVKFDKAYERAKTYISCFVGWDALISRELQPALHTSKAYDIVRDRLAAECWAGHGERSTRDKFLMELC